jgi:hypothetical protein
VCEENAVGFGLWLAYYWPFWFRGRSQFSISRLKASFRSEQYWRKESARRSSCSAQLSIKRDEALSSVLIGSVLFRWVGYHDHGSRDCEAIIDPVREHVAKYKIIVLQPVLLSPSVDMLLPQLVQ